MTGRNSTVRRNLLAMATIACAIWTGTPAAEAKDPIVITMDRAKVMRLPGPAGTVIIGNPGIADATVHDRMTLVLTGKTVGITNLVVLDAKGNPIADEILQVSKIQEGLVTVQRAGARYSYFCTPHCNNMFEVGDAADHFTNTNTQIQMRNSFGQGNSGAPQ